MTMSSTELKSALEAIIYVADEPATVDQLASVLGEEKHVVRAALDELVASFANDERGVEIRAVAGGDFSAAVKTPHSIDASTVTGEPNEAAAGKAAGEAGEPATADDNTDQGDTL